MKNANKALEEAGSWGPLYPPFNFPGWHVQSLPVQETFNKIITPGYRLVNFMISWIMSMEGLTPLMLCYYEKISKETCGKRGKQGLTRLSVCY